MLICENDSCETKFLLSIRATRTFLEMEKFFRLGGKLEIIYVLPFKALCGMKLVFEYQKAREEFPLFSIWWSVVVLLKISSRRNECPKSILSVFSTQHDQNFGCLFLAFLSAVYLEKINIRENQYLMIKDIKRCYVWNL